MATEKVRVINIDTNPAETSVKELRGELKELRNTLLSTEEGTEEYNQALVKSANIQHTLKEQMEEINASAMDFGQITGNVVKATGGLVAGFQAAQATMNLFGVENETVIKSLEKMQNLMAITQAIPALDDGVKAFKRLSTAISTAAGATSKFSKALISTGLGALAVALGLIITNFDKISAWLDEITGQTDFLGTVADAVIGGLNAAWAGLVQTLKVVGSAIVTYVTAPFKSVWAAIQAYTSTEGGFVDKLKAAGKAMKNGFVSDWKDVGNDFKQIGVVSANAYQSGYEKHKAKRLAKNVEDAEKEGKKEGKAKGEAKAEAEAEAEEAAYKKRLRNIDKEERTEMLALQAKRLNYEEYVKEKEALEDKFTKKQINALKETLANSKDLTDLTEQEIADLENQLIDLQDKLVKKPESEKSDGEGGDTQVDVKTKGEEAASALYSLRDALADVATDNAWGVIFNNIGSMAGRFADLAKGIKEDGEDSWSSYIQMAAIALNTVGTILSQLASQEDANTKEGFERQKKLQIAATTMNMLGGIASAWISAMNPANAWMTIWGQIALGAATSAMILGTGITQMQKIKSTQFGGGSVSGSSATPNAGAINSVIAPVQYTQDVQGASIEGAIRDSKQYVAVTEINEVGNRVEVTENEAMF